MAYEEIYTKPANGIPKTDLTSEVQASLDKADSALQSVPNLDASKITSGTFADARIASASTWNGKSTVSVGASGSATAEVQYITVNGVEYKLAGGGGGGSTPDLGTTTLSTSWTGTASPYTQTVTVDGATVTATSKVDIQPNSTALAQMLTDGCNALYIENNNGTLTAYAIGEHPTTALTLQVCVTEVTL